MEEKYQHKCIKCGESYFDIDPEPYYCKACIDIKNKIAKEIDAKMANHVSKKPVSDFQNYEAIRKANGVVKIQDLGITL